MGYYGHCDICGYNITDIRDHIRKSNLECPNSKNHAGILKMKEVHKRAAITADQENTISVSKFARNAERARQRVLKRLRKKGKNYESPEFRTKLIHCTTSSFSNGFRVPWDEDN